MGTTGTEIVVGVRIGIGIGIGTGREAGIGIAIGIDSSCGAWMERLCGSGVAVKQPRPGAVIAAGCNIYGASAE